MANTSEANARFRPPSLTSIAVTFAIAVAALYFGRQLFMPLALAIVLSFVLAPVVLFFRRMHFGRVGSVAVAVALALAVILGIGTVIGGQLAQLAGNLPQYQSTISRKISFLRESAAGSGIVERASSMLGELRRDVTAGPGPAATPANPVGTQQRKPVPVEIHQAPTTPLRVIRNILGPVSEPLATIALVIIFAIFILLQREDLRDRFIRLAGPRDLHRTTKALDDGVQRLSRYFLMQSAINAVFGVLIGVGLYFIGLPEPVLWGVVAMLLRFIPYVGVIAAAIFPAALAFAVVPGWSMLAWTAALFVAIEPIMSQFAEPMLYGHSTGLSPIAVVLAAVFWTSLWGVVGLFLSVPLTVCLVVIGSHVEHLQFLAVLLGDRPALAPEESFYQRTLAGDPEEAIRHAEECLKGRSLGAYYDEIVLKALALAQSDVSRGLLDRQRRIQIKKAIDSVIDDLSDRDDASLIPVTMAADSSRGPLAEAPAQESRGEQNVAVLCVAGRGLLDEAAATMLSQLLQKRGIGARVVPNSDVSPANISNLAAAGASAVCLSYLEPGDFTNARYAIRRIRRKLPAAKVFLGLWGQRQREFESHSALQEVNADLVVTSLRHAADRIAAETRAAASGVAP